MSNVVQRYFDAVYAGNVDAMLDCLANDVAHHANEDKIRVAQVSA
jgi:ketosteroid isomerase-like protein